MTQTTPSTSAQGKLVPVEPTDEMRQAGERAWMNRDLMRDDTNPLSDCYRAMLAASPSPAASPASPSGDAVLTIDALAQEIRRVDGKHSLGAGALAEAILPFIARAIASLASDATPAPTSGSEDGGEAWTDVLAERRRQVQAEGWTPEHDDTHTDGEMADAAALYASMRVRHITGFATWPWDEKWWKPKDRRSDLVRAGALILAEIERLDRKDGRS